MSASKKSIYVTTETAESGKKYERLRSAALITDKNIKSVTFKPGPITSPSDFKHGNTGGGFDPGNRKWFLSPFSVEYEDGTVSDSTFIDNIVIDVVRSNPSRGFIYVGIPEKVMKAAMKAGIATHDISKDTSVVSDQVSSGYLWVSTKTDKIVNCLGVDDKHTASVVPLSKLIEGFRDENSCVVCCTVGKLRLKTEVTKDDGVEEAKKSPWTLAYTVESLFAYGDVEMIGKPRAGRSEVKASLPKHVRGSRKMMSVMKSLQSVIDDE